MIKKIFICLMMMCFARSAYANISIFPYSIDFESQSRRRIQSVRVINTSKETQTYRVSVINFLQDKKGNLTETKESKDYFADPYLTFSPRQFTLKPNEVQTIHVARKSLAKAKDGEYISHLKINEVNVGKPQSEQNNKNKQVSVNIKALFAVTLPITINKGVEKMSQAEYVNHKLLSSESIQVTLKRKGDRSAKINLFILDDQDRQIGLVKNLKIYKSTSELTFSLPIEKSKHGDKVVIKVEDAKQQEEIFRQVITL